MTRGFPMCDFDQHGEAVVFPRSIGVPPCFPYVRMHSGPDAASPLRTQGGH